MRRSYQDRNAEYAKRLRLITPLAGLLLLALLFTTREVSYQNVQKHLGWEGAPRLLPEITIMPDKDPFEDMAQEPRTRASTALNVEKLEEPGPGDIPAPQPEPVETPEETSAPEIEGADERRYPAHTEVPYSEDYVILHMVRPEYPSYELDNGIEGEVTLEVLVSVAGEVEGAWVLEARGPRSFEAASLEAIQQFRFKPPIVDGQATQMWIRFLVRFRIMG